MEASEKTAWMSILTNFLLVSIKVAVALFSGSLAVKADVLHSLSDVVSSGVILIGISALLMKPVAVAEMAETIRKVLDKSI